MKSRDVEFIYEIGTLRFIQRTWKQFIKQVLAMANENYDHTPEAQ